MSDVLEKVGELTENYFPEEGIGSEYDLAAEFIFDDEKYAIYLINHKKAKEARVLLKGLASGLVQLQCFKEEEL